MTEFKTQIIGEGRNKTVIELYKEDTVYKTGLLKNILHKINRFKLPKKDDLVETQKIALVYLIKVPKHENVDLVENTRKLLQLTWDQIPTYALYNPDKPYNLDFDFPIPKKDDYEAADKSVLPWFFDIPSSDKSRVIGNEQGRAVLYVLNQDAIHADVTFLSHPDDSTEKFNFLELHFLKKYPDKNQRNSYKVKLIQNIKEEAQKLALAAAKKGWYLPKDAFCCYLDTKSLSLIKVTCADVDHVYKQEGADWLFSQNKESVKTYAEFFAKRLFNGDRKSSEVF